MPLLKASKNETLNFTKKEELVYNSIYSFKPIAIEDMKLRGTKYIKIVLLVLVLVRVKFFQMPQFHLKALGYEKMKNPDEKVNIEAFCDAKKLYLKGRGYLPIRE